MKETIFVFIYGYLPGIKYGGPVTSIYNFTEYFGNKYDIRIICSNHDHGDDRVYQNISNDWNTVGKAQVMYLSERNYSKKNFLNIMRTFNVCMVYLTGVFSYSLNHAAVSAARKIGTRIVIAIRGEICRNILAMKGYKKIPYLWVMKIIKEYRDIFFQVTSDEEKEQLKRYLNIPEKRTIMLPNIHGKTMNIIRPAKHSGSAKIIFISRIHPKKNLIEAIEAAIAVEKGVLEFDIYGSIEDEGYWNKCQQLIKKAPPNVHIRYQGELDMTMAKESYYHYHAFLFPTLSENYGHVIVEAMIAECLVIISRGTTPWDDINGNGGFLTKLHDINEMTKILENIILMDETTLNIERKKLVKYRDNKLQLKTLLNGYERLISG